MKRKVYGQGLLTRLIKMISGSMEGISVGEAKRRQKLDPSYGQTKIVRNACNFIDNLWLEKKKKGWSQDVPCFVFTNKDRGCTVKEIELLEKEIPKRYKNHEMLFWALPQEYAHLPPEEALNYFVQIDV